MKARGTRFAYGLAALALGLAALLGAGGCRDATEGGSRWSEQHILRSRPTARGGPAITNEERQRGWFEARTEDLAAAESQLRRMVDLRVNVLVDEGPGRLPGTVWVHGADTLTRITTGDYRDTPMPEPWPLSTPLRSFDVENVLDEIELACDNDLLTDVVGSSCDDVRDFDTTNRWVEGFDMRLTASEIGLAWAPPIERYNVRVSRGRVGEHEGESCDAEDPCPFGYQCVVGTPGTPGVCDWGDWPCSEDLDCVDDRDPSGTFPDMCNTSTGLCEVRSKVRFRRDASMEQPVLQVTLPWSVDTDADFETSVALGTIDITAFDAELRIQPLPCATAACRARNRTYAGYRGSSPGGDLQNNGVGLRFTVQAKLGRASHVFYPGVAGFFVCGLNPLYCIFEAESGVRKALYKVLDKQAQIFRMMITEARLPPTMDIDFLEGVLWQILARDQGVSHTSGWYSAVTARTRLDTTGTVVSYPDGSTAPLMATDGALTGALPQAVSTGAGLVGFAIDAFQLRNLCGADPTTTIGGLCGADTDGDGIPAFMDPTEPRAPSDCNICTECNSTGSPLCDFSADSAGAVRVQVGPTLPSGASIEEDPAYPLIEALQFPSVPDLALFLDSSYNFAHELRQIFAAPLDAALSAGRYYTDVRYCPAGARLDGCPGWASRTEDGVVFHFPGDSDLDGVPDDLDLCPDTASPDGMHGDWDGDGLGNDCDLCPLHPGHNGDRDGDGIGDICDCDIDDDGCHNELSVMPVDVDGVPPGIASCDMTGPIWDQDPTVSDFGADNDSDGDSDHCDPDDDDDGVLDDGAGDGLGAYTPCLPMPCTSHAECPGGSCDGGFCEPGSLTACDDNCQFAPDASQSDVNADGIGDTCDPICPSASAYYCDPPESGGGRADSMGPGALIERVCRPDGRWCRFLTVECASFRSFQSFGWPGVVGGCSTPDSFLRLFDPEGREVWTVDLGPVLANQGWASVATAIFGPDLTGDGVPEIFLGAPDPNAGGLVAAVKSDDGSVLWTVRGNGMAGFYSGGFGASLAYGEGVLFVGAPDAQQMGAVFAVDPWGQVYGPYVNGQGFGFGASLALAYTNPNYEGDENPPALLFVGDPLAYNTAGRVHVFEAQPNPVFLGTFAGEQPGTHLGAGPMQVSRFRLPLRDDMTAYWSGQHEAIIMGAPFANGGAGLVAAYLWTGETFMHPGNQGDHLGASLSPVMDFDGNGMSEVLVGAPGYMQGRGAVLPLQNDLALGSPWLTGTPGDRVGLCVNGGTATGDAATLLVGAGGMTDTNGLLLGQWVHYEGTVGVP